jgi:hypothetical protein
MNDEQPGSNLSDEQREGDAVLPHLVCEFTNQLGYSLQISTSVEGIAILMTL